MKAGLTETPVRRLLDEAKRERTCCAIPARSGPTLRGQFVPKRSARRSHQPLFPRRNWPNRCLPVRLPPSTHERARTGCLPRFLRLSVWSGFIRSLRGQAEAKNLAMISPGSNGPLTRSRGRIPTAARLDPPPEEGIVKRDASPFPTFPDGVKRDAVPFPSELFRAGALSKRAPPPLSRAVLGRR